MIKCVNSWFKVTGVALSLCLAVSSSNGLAQSGDNVREAQQVLQQLGYSPGTADGIWGAKTEKAIKNGSSVKFVG